MTKRFLHNIYLILYLDRNWLNIILCIYLLKHIILLFTYFVLVSEHKFIIPYIMLVVLVHPFAQ